MGLLLHDFPDFWQHLYHLVLLLRCDWYFCYGYGTFATRWYFCYEIRKLSRKPSLDPTWTTEAVRQRHQVRK